MRHTFGSLPASLRAFSRTPNWCKGAMKWAGIFAKHLSHVRHTDIVARILNRAGEKQANSTEVTVLIERSLRSFGFANSRIFLWKIFNRGGAATTTNGDDDARSAVRISSRTNLVTTGPPESREEPCFSRFTRRVSRLTANLLFFRTTVHVTDKVRLRRCF